MIIPQLKLDDLLSELQARLATAVATRDRVHALLEAVVSIGSDLELETVLRRITEVATRLVDARYGALGVIAESGEHLAQFITVGVAPQEIEAIGHWPHGHGILGLLIKEPHPLRLPHLDQHPESVGLPVGHPAMHRFLGVPIRVRNEVFGNLYLTEKSGGGVFEEEDEVIVTALATAAGVAIENARLYAESRQRERWLTASSRVSNALLSGTPPEEVLGIVAEEAREISGADLTVVFLADRDADELIVEAVSGADNGPSAGARVPLDRALGGSAYRTGRSTLLPDVGETTDPADLPEGMPRGPALVVPLGSEESTVRGVLSLTKHRGGSPFTDTTRRLLEPFAVQAAVALTLAESRSDSERLRRLEDRDRIAKDLHDTVIQRLFASAMTLMSAAKLTDSPEAGKRIQKTVDNLDDTIRQIRSTIFALQADLDEESLRSRVYTLVDAAAGILGFAPSVSLDGLLDTAVPPEIAEHLLAVVNEMLSNAVRHAHARRIDVTLDAREALVLRVEDDGVGIPEDGRRSGLRNITERAESLGGTFEIRARDGGGTSLFWKVPLT